MRASYRAGVVWIAENDNAGDGDSVDDIAGYISTLLLADLFGKDPAIVARSVARLRAAAGIEVGDHTDTLTRLTNHYGG